MIESNFLNTANNLYEEAFSANACWLLLQQYRKNSTTYQDEMQCSPAFYSVIYYALIDSLFLSLSKLYDRNPKSLTLRNLLEEIGDLDETDLHSSVREKYNFCGQAFQHTLKPVEEPYFPKEVSEHKRMLSLLSLKNHPLTINLSLSQLVALYIQRFQALQNQAVICNLINLRNKILAHNDRLTNFKYDSIWKDYPLSDNQIEALLEFALDFLLFCIEILTGVQRATESVNINDWQETLEYVKIGCSCRDDYLKKMYNEDP